MHGAVAEAGEDGGEASDVLLDAGSGRWGWWVTGGVPVFTRGDVQLVSLFCRAWVRRIAGHEDKRIHHAEGAGAEPPPASPHSLDAGLVDQFGRRATDLRISLIDKCNLRCTYCMPENGLPWLKKEQLMSLDEVVRLVRIAVETFGVRELRLTGGEPLVRHDLVDVIAAIRSEHPDLPIAMTTNAIGLERKAEALADAGLTRVNISLDSIHRETFAQLTRRDQLEKVLVGVEAAAEAGLTPLKVNAVLMRGINDAEAGDLLAWCLENDFELRFIEHMPLDADQNWKREGTVSAAETRELLGERFDLAPTDEDRAVLLRSALMCLIRALALCWAVWA